MRFVTVISVAGTFLGQVYNRRMTTTWFDSMQAELENGEAARARGNEGMARVCARRAAGYAAAEYFKRMGIDFRNPSAYERLRYLQTLPNVPEDVRAACAALTLRVDTEYRLPPEVDLLRESRRLMAWLCD
ncbi:MAG: hypothetical protein OHK0052_20840 [Anaerolineales bacterium]